MFSNKVMHLIFHAPTAWSFRPLSVDSMIKRWHKFLAAGVKLVVQVHFLALNFEVSWHGR